ncbi:hypothetical protein KS4_24740 [Poriferisphaera corsica]|uniref:Uncharacterized protein n=1 Tax=Poriferisphaera corsica TaxID=2528020 RepID=A0A517YW09_9BACT|nr:hypothetical protein [Poriferisphaera corsica]QDU34405.1 hypothetical protein KS4_24740 [Poriferisphaera corsica]
MMNKNSQNQKQAKPKSMMQLTSRFTLTVLAILTILGLWGYWQWISVPEYWTENQAYLAQTDTVILSQNATILEDSIPDKLTNPNNLSAQSTRKVRIPLELINAWLEVRLPLWLHSQYGYDLPDNIKGIMLATEGDNLVLAFEIDQENFNQIISAIFEIQFNGDNSATLKLIGLRAGTLPLPINASLKQFGEIENMTGEDAGIQITKLGDGLKFTPTHSLGSDRDAQIIGLETEKDSVIIHIKHAAHKSQSSRHAASRLTHSILN